MPSAEACERVTLRRLTTAAVVLTLAALFVGVLYQPWLAHVSSIASALPVPERRGQPASAA